MLVEGEFLPFGSQPAFENHNRHTHLWCNLSLYSPVSRPVGGGGPAVEARHGALGPDPRIRAGAATPEQFTKLARVLGSGP